MFTSTINYIYTSIIELITAILSGKGWILKTTLITVFLSLFFAFPSYTTLKDVNSKPFDAWVGVVEKINDPLVNLMDKYQPSDRAYTLNYRITAPLIGKILGLNITSLVAFAFLVGVGVFSITSLIIYRLTGNKISAFLITLSVGFIFAGTTSFVELRGNFDGLALFFLLLAIFSNHPLAIFPAIFLAAWTDERAIFASSFVFLYYLYEIKKTGNLKSQVSNLGAILLALAAYFVTRFSIYPPDMISQYAKAGLNGPGFILEYFNMIPMGIWTGFEGLWLLVIGSLVVLIRQKKVVFAGLFILCLAGMIWVGHSALDISRGMAYCFPALFVAVKILAESEQAEDLNKLSLVAFVLSFLWPAYYAGGKTTIWWQYPLPIQLVRWLAGR